MTIMAKVGRPRKAQTTAEEAPIIYNEENKAKFYTWKKNTYETNYPWLTDSYKKRTKYTNSRKYTDYYSTGLGSWMEMSFNHIGLEILNNLPTIAYNYQMKCPERLSLVSYMFNQANIHQAIDVVLHHIQIKLYMPKHDLTEKEIVVTNKKQLVQEIFSRKHDIIHIIYPKGEADLYEETLYCQKLEWYVYHVIRRYLYMKANEICANFFVSVLTGKTK